MADEQLSFDESLTGIERSVDRLVEALRKERAMMQHLLKQIGAKDICRGNATTPGCDAQILWVRHRFTDTSVPYNVDGSPHFATCPKALEFRKRGKHAQR